MKPNIDFALRQPWMHAVSTACLGLLAALCLAIGPASGASAATPELPPELRQNAAGQMVLLDFHSPLCSACRMMEPHVQRLLGTTDGKIYYRQLDLNDADNRKYMEQFDITSTPTYVLFAQDGKPLYRMEALISPSLLETQVLRQTGQLKPVEVPGPLLKAIHAGPADPASLHNLLLVSFDSAACTACKRMDPYLTGFEMAGQSGLSILRVDADTPDGKALQKALAIDKLPGYALLDNTDSSKELLHVMQSDIKPRDLWNVIRLFGEDGLNGSFLEHEE